MDLIRAYACGLLPDFTISGTRVYHGYKNDVRIKEIRSEAVKSLHAMTWNNFQIVLMNVVNNKGACNYIWRIQARELCQKLLQHYDYQQGLKYKKLIYYKIEQPGQK